MISYSNETNNNANCNLLKLKISFDFLYNTYIYQDNHIYEKRTFIEKYENARYFEFNSFELFHWIMLEFEEHNISKNQVRKLDLWN